MPRCRDPHPSRLSSVCGAVSCRTAPLGGQGRLWRPAAVSGYQTDVLLLRQRRRCARPPAPRRVWLSARPHHTRVTGSADTCHGQHGHVSAFDKPTLMEPRPGRSGTLIAPLRGLTASHELCLVGQATMVINLSSSIRHYRSQPLRDSQEII